jgi:hypothetical protein
MPADGGLAFEVIQHLDPDRVSYISGILAKITSMGNVLRDSEQKVRDQAKELEQKLIASDDWSLAARLPLRWRMSLIIPSAASWDSLPTLGI